MRRVGRFLATVADVIVNFWGYVAEAIVWAYSTAWGRLVLIVLVGVGIFLILR
jgi:hypothetical protein